jgi:hypothetical protein
MGSKKAVKIIKIKAKPSIPKIQLIFIAENQLFTSRN